MGALHFTAMICGHYTEIIWLVVDFFPSSKLSWLNEWMTWKTNQYKVLCMISLAAQEFSGRILQLFNPQSFWCTWLDCISCILCCNEWVNGSCLWLNEHMLLFNQRAINGWPMSFIFQVLLLTTNFRFKCQPRFSTCSLKQMRLVSSLSLLLLS